MRRPAEAERSPHRIHAVDSGHSRPRKVRRSSQLARKSAASVPSTWARRVCGSRDGARRPPHGGLVTTTSGRRGSRQSAQLPCCRRTTAPTSAPSMHLAASTRLGCGRGRPQRERRVGGKRRPETGQSGGARAPSMQRHAGKARTAALVQCVLLGSTPWALGSHLTAVVAGDDAGPLGPDLAARVIDGIAPGSRVRVGPCKVCPVTAQQPRRNVVRHQRRLHQKRPRATHRVCHDSACTSAPPSSDWEGMLTGQASCSAPCLAAVSIKHVRAGGRMGVCGDADQARYQRALTSAGQDATARGQQRSQQSKCRPRCAHQRAQ